MLLNKELSKIASLLRNSLPKVIKGHKKVKEALGMTDEQIYAWAVTATNLAKQGSFSDARDLLEGLVVIDPDNAYLHSCLGSLYMQINEKNLAAGHLLLALKLNPDDIAATTNLGELFFESGNLDSAAHHLNRSLELTPLENNPFASRAKALLELLSNIEK